MAIALVQSKTYSSDTSYVNGATLVLTSNVLAGSTLVLFAASTVATADVVVITDSNGNTWTKVLSIAGNGRGGDLWYAKNCNAGATTVYLTDTANYAERAVVVLEYSGVDTVNALDASAYATETGYNNTHTVSVTNTVQPALVVGGFVGSGGTGTYTATGLSGNKIQATTTGEYTNMVTVDDNISVTGSNPVTLSADIYEQGIFLIAALKEAVTVTNPTKRYNGTAMVATVGKRFNGTSWVDITGTKV